MPDRIEVTPLTGDDLPAAAELLASRQRRLRGARPILPEAYEDPAAALPLVEALAGKDGAFGVIGRADGARVRLPAGLPAAGADLGPRGLEPHRGQRPCRRHGPRARA